MLMQEEFQMEIRMRKMKLKAKPTHIFYSYIHKYIYI